MKIFYVVIVFCFLLVTIACKDSKQNTINNEDKKAGQESLVIAPTDENSKDINLEPLMSAAPKFEDSQVNSFVNETKKYFEQVAQATKEGNSDKIVELQLHANEVDAKLQKVKKRLSVQQQKQLNDWYMLLVDAASQ